MVLGRTEGAAIQGGQWRRLRKCESEGLCQWGWQRGSQEGGLFQNYPSHLGVGSNSGIVHLVWQGVFQEYGQFSGQSQPGWGAIWPDICSVFELDRNMSSSCGEWTLVLGRENHKDTVARISGLKWWLGVPDHKCHSFIQLGWITKRGRSRGAICHWSWFGGE